MPSPKKIRIEADSLPALAAALIAEIESAAETNAERAEDDYEATRRNYAAVAEFVGTLSEYRPFLESCLETALENVSDSQEAIRAIEEEDPDEGWEPAPQYGVLTTCPRCGGVRDRDPGGGIYCTECGR